MPLLSSTKLLRNHGGCRWHVGITSPQSNLFSTSNAGTIDLNADQVIVSASNLFYSTTASRPIVVNWIKFVQMARRAARRWWDGLPFGWMTKLRS